VRCFVASDVIDVGYSDSSTLAREQLSGTAADPRPSSGNKSDLPCEPSHAATPIDHSRCNARGG
jgi:hypothetical protein